MATGRDHSRTPSVAVLPPYVPPRIDASPSTLNGALDSLHLEQSSDMAEHLAVSIDGKPALICHDQEFLFVIRGHSSANKDDPTRAFLRVPLALVLHTSFVSDSDGGSLLVRLLSPPLQNANNGSGLLPFLNKSKTIPECMRPLSQSQYENLTPKLKVRRLREQLDGPCANLRLFKIEARISNPKAEENVEQQAENWVEQVMTKAYPHVKPFRRVKMLVNPVGGPGKARQLFESRVRPIFEAAGCKLDLTCTAYRNHGLDIAYELDVESYDVLATMSGDGLIHEVLNGLAIRTDAARALRLPIAPIPAGSGNAMAINLMGVQNGFSLALACLNIIKGTPLVLDLLTITQPASAFPPGAFIPGMPTRKKAVNTAPGEAATASASRDSEDAALITETPSKPFVRYYSFLSQAIGLMADLDLGTEHLRALGDTRFLIGYATGVLKNNACEIDVDVKLDLRGSKSKAVMRDRVRDFIENSKTGSAQPSNAEGGDANGSSGPEQQEAAGDDEAREWGRDAFGNERFERDTQPPLRHGSVMDPIVQSGAQPPPFDFVDPSWSRSIVPKLRQSNRVKVTPDTFSADGDSETSSLSWCRVQEPLVSLYGGKVPFVGRDLLQFPYALPGDGTIDVAVMMHGGGRASQLPESGFAENGQVVYQKAMGYLKVEALRVTPRHKEGVRKLNKGGMISIDGERVPYAAFQVEVAHGRNWNVLSLYGQFCVDVVEPPKKWDERSK